LLATELLRQKRQKSTFITSKSSGVARLTYLLACHSLRERNYLQIIDEDLVENQTGRISTLRRKCTSSENWFSHFRAPRAELHFTKTLHNWSCTVRTSPLRKYAWLLCLLSPPHSWLFSLHGVYASFSFHTFCRWRHSSFPRIPARLNGYYLTGTQPVILGGAISATFGIQVSLCAHDCKRDEVYFTTVLRQSSGRQNGLISRMLFSELYKIMVKKVAFVGFRGGDRPNRLHLDAPLLPEDNSMIKNKPLKISILCCCAQIKQRLKDLNPTHVFNLNISRGSNFPGELNYWFLTVFLSRVRHIFTDFLAVKCRVEHLSWDEPFDADKFKSDVLLAAGECLFRPRL